MGLSPDTCGGCSDQDFAVDSTTVVGTTIDVAASDYSADPRA